MEMRPSSDPDAVLQRFCGTYSDAVLKRAYRRPLVYAPGERHWEFWEGGELVGWGSIMQIGPGEYSYRLGVMAHHQRKGYRAIMRVMLGHEAFRDPTCQKFITSTALGNPAQTVHVLNDALAGRWLPVEVAVLEGQPRIIYSATREWWESKFQGETSCLAPPNNVKR